MSQCNCHCDVTNIACDTCCILCLEIDINIIKREMVYSSFLLITISVLFSLFFFQFLDSPLQKITMRDFHQEVTFKQYFYLHQQFKFLCADCLIVYLSGFFFFFFFWGGGRLSGGGGWVCVCVCLDYSRTNEQIFI